MCWPMLQIKCRLLMFALAILLERMQISCYSFFLYFYFYFSSLSLDDDLSIMITMLMTDNYWNLISRYLILTPCFCVYYSFWMDGLYLQSMQDPNKHLLNPRTWVQDMETTLVLITAGSEPDVRENKFSYSTSIHK